MAAGAADTARLIASLVLDDKFTPGVNKAIAGTGRLESGLSHVSGRALPSFQRAIGGIGGAVSHAAGRLKMLAGSVGLLGGLAIGGGILGFLEQGINKAKDFGDEVVRLARLTGMSIPTTSSLASALEHFGISADGAKRSIGFLEKNVGALAAKKGAVEKFQKAFGFALLDSNGHLKDANQLLLTSADFFNNKSIPATRKAAALAKLYGRSWQDLIPILSAGRKGITEVENEAARLGLRLSVDNVKDLQALKNATRDWNTALGGLQLQIGLLVIPQLTELSRAATKFISDPDNRKSLIGFFKGVVSTGRDIAGVIANSVVPTIQGLVGAAKSFWSSIPAPLQDLLVKGIVGDRVIKFAFGFSPASIAKDAIGGLLAGGLKGALGGLFQRGGSPANPMWVASAQGGIPGIGGVGGAAAGAGEAAAGGEAAAALGGILAPGFGTLLLTALAPLVFLDVIPELFKNGGTDRTPINVRGSGGQDFGTLSPETSAQFRGLSSGINNLVATSGALSTATRDMDKNIEANGPAGRDMDKVLAKPTTVLERLAAQGIDLQALARRQAESLGRMASTSWIGQALDGPVTKLSKVLASALAGVKSGGKDLLKWAKELGAKVGHGGAGAGGLVLAQNSIAALQSALGKATDPKTAAAIRSAIHEITARLPHLQWNKVQLAAARQIAGSSESTGQRVRELEAIRKLADAHGSKTLVSKLDSLISATKLNKPPAPHKPPATPKPKDPVLKDPALTQAQKDTITKLSGVRTDTQLVAAAQDIQRAVLGAKLDTNSAAIDQTKGAVSSGAASTVAAMNAASANIAAAVRALKLVVNVTTINQTTTKSSYYGSSGDSSNTKRDSNGDKLR